MQRFETFHRQKYESVILRETELCARFGLPPAPATITDIELVEQSELAFILFVYEGLLRELDEVQWFDRINETAITRIFDKLANNLQDTSDYHRFQSQWLAMQQTLEEPRKCAQERISNLTTDIRRISALSLQPTRSLYINTASASAPENLYRLVQDNELVALQEFYLSCDSAMDERRKEFEKLFYDLFIAAILMESKHSTNFLLEILLKHNFIMDTNQMLFFLGLCGQRTENNSKLTPEHWLNKLFDGPCALTKFFLQDKDSQGRLALHYGAQYGLKDFCEALIYCTINSDNPELVADALCLRDHDGMTTFHYVVLSGDTPLLTVLLKGLFDSNNNKKSKLELQPLLGELLILSVRASQDSVSKILINNQPNLDYTSPRGETALYCAAQANNLDLVKLLLTYTQHGLDANIATAMGWTPLIVACANGHSDLVGCLLEAGVEPESCDVLGWTAREHAVFRGHLGIATLFTSTPLEDTHSGPAVSRGVVHKKSPRITSEDGERLVVVNLGSTQGGHDRAVFNLSQCNSARDNGLGAASSLVLEISAPGTKAKAKMVRLPVLEDQINQPFIFQAKQSAPLQIAIKLYRRESIDSMTLLSGGTTTLDHGKVFFGKNRESMIREMTIFMMDKETMDFAGTVLLSYVVATPFAGLQQVGTANYQRRLGDPTRLVGHRGISPPYLCGVGNKLTK
jgi:glycerophosphodiester phosphodiesterase